MKKWSARYKLLSVFPHGALKLCLIVERGNNKNNNNNDDDDDNNNINDDDDDDNSNYKYNNNDDDDDDDDDGVDINSNCSVLSSFKVVGFFSYVFESLVHSRNMILSIISFSQPKLLHHSISASGFFRISLKTSFSFKSSFS